MTKLPTTPTPVGPTNVPGDLTPNPVIAPGNSAVFVPKNPLQSTATWGLVVMLLTWAIHKWVPSLFQDQALSSALEILGELVGAGITLYGRWTAHRPLGLSSAPATTVVK